MIEWFLMHIETILTILGVLWIIVFLLALFISPLNKEMKK